LQAVRQLWAYVFRQEFWSIGLIHAIWLLFLCLLFGVLAIKGYKAQTIIEQKSPVAARIDRVWIVRGRGGGTFAAIAYQRATPVGLIDCHLDVRLARAHQPATPGQWIPIIPREDSCYEPVVLGQARHPQVYAILSMMALLLSALMGYGHFKHSSCAQTPGRDAT
jgi:hypothetical protein